ncbi:hypothetical protein GRF29_1536g424291 [Pseudopithomyces chartarum]|uniref:Uncharacterized protein n=1 Tax=Pseudopithomyces chartarum TaxID=1892770 RepID=A0AAN6LLH7_9PLEO|nr:hypothetical protein GRF29_1536g424291 [Pseudopithomyces chartarum]
MGRYTAVHTHPKGVGDARPTALQIIHDEGLEGKLTGKVIVLTGATSGIGLETARALLTTGATLFLTVRDSLKAKGALAELLTSGRVTLVDMDNASLSSVRTAAKQILDQSDGKINILIGNAGIMGIQQRELTEDGHEFHFAVNHLSHFLLFYLLKDALLASSSPSFHSRLVLLSSSAHRTHRLLPSNNYSFQDTPYVPEVAYANSKLANIYTASYVERQYGSRGLHATPEICGCHRGGSGDVVGVEVGGAGSGDDGGGGGGEGVGGERREVFGGLRGGGERKG